MGNENLYSFTIFFSIYGSLTIMIKENPDRRKQFLRLLFFLFVVLFCFSYDGKVTAYNTTLYAFSYKYGFISRAFIGSLFQGIDYLVPWDMMSYTHSVLYTQVVTALFYVLLLWFFSFILKQLPGEAGRGTKYAELIIVAYTIYAVPMFACRKNFGRVDIYLVGLSLLAVVLIVKNKGLFLLPVIVAVCVCIHQGYVFMFFNIILVLLIYRIFSPKSEHKFLFILCFLLGSALFLYFEFFSRTNGEAFVDEIIENATKLSYKGDYHETLIDHEILGIDLASEEWDFHKENFVQFPIYLLLMSPFLYMLFRLFGEIRKRVETTGEKIRYFFVCAGPLTLLPNYILKVDYARWTFAVFTYYTMVILALLAWKDRIMEESISRVAQIRQRYPFVFLLLPYLLLFSPLWDVYMCQALKRMSDWINVFVHFM